MCYHWRSNDVCAETTDPMIHILGEVWVQPGFSCRSDPAAKGMLVGAAIFGRIGLESSGAQYVFLKALNGFIDNRKYT